MFYITVKQLLSLHNFAYFTRRFDDVAGIHNSRHTTTSENIVNHSSSEISGGYRVMSGEER